MQAEKQQLPLNTILLGDALTRLKELPDESIDCIFTSPPYWAQRDYGVEGQLGLEPTFYEYIDDLLAVFDEAKRVLKKTGTCWVNIGDTYFGAGFGSDPNFEDSKQASNMGTVQGRERIRELRRKFKGYQEKCLCLIPQRFVTGMVDHGWICRGEGIWYKPNRFPDGFKDRFSVDFEKVFMFSKSKKYLFNYHAIRLPLAPATMKRNEYGVGSINRLDIGVNTRVANGYIDPSDKKTRKMGSVWIWSIAPQTFGYEYCPACDKLVPDRDLLFKCKACNTTYEKIKPAELAKKQGLDPEAACQFCGRSIKRHFSPNARDRNAGLRPDYLPCPGMEKIQYKGSGCPGCGTKKKDLLCNVCKTVIHAHYAMFPEELAEIPVTAGVPEHVCTECGKPRFPIYEPTEEYKQYLGKGWHEHDNDEQQGMQQEHDIPNTTAEYKVTGWTDCGCGASFKPGVILDPFSGFGTVASVALQHGRQFVGIDLDPLNIKATMKRIEPYMAHKSLFDQY